MNYYKQKSRNQEAFLLENWHHTDRTCQE